MIVVSDASPIRYLVLLDAVNILPTLFGEVVVPPVVVRELQHASSPAEVVAWLAFAPDWLAVKAPQLPMEKLDLDAGEAEAIQLANELRADRLLIDDKKGRKIAEERGIKTAGTLTILLQAADQGLIELQPVLHRLEKTNFRISAELLKTLLNRNSTK